MAKLSLPNSIFVNKSCSIKGCPNLIYCKSLCNKHYKRQKKYGNPLFSLTSTSDNPRKCSIDDCDKNYYANSFCQTHNLRFYRTGNPLGYKTLRGKGNSEEEKFWSKIKTIANPEKCWEWQGCRNTKGYGLSTFKGKRAVAHRIAFYLHNGYWATNDVCHSCDNPPCCNPNHLWEGTRKENMADMMAKGRGVGKKKKPKLTPENILKIRELLNNNQRIMNIARLFNVSCATIYDIKKERKWKWVK